MPRKRTGELYRSRGSWYARLTVVEQGVNVRRRVPLGTDIKAIARSKLDAMLSGDDPALASRGEGFAAAARRVVTSSRIVTASERLSRLERYAFPILGEIVAAKVRASQVKAVLEAAAAAGLGRSAVEHLHDDMAAVLQSLWRDEQVKENVAQRVSPADVGARTDGRPRVVLTDSEFSRLIAWPGLSLELRTMCLASRCLGGMRTSDLHAWSWEHVDTEGWASASVPRPKTRTSARLTLPDLLVPSLHAWWLATGKARRGPVFPGPSGKRRGKRSHARELRRALWLAGVRRGEAVEQCELQTDTALTRRVDFHSFRRAFATGLAIAGVNNQVAMALADHASPQTHARYVRLVETLVTPEAALPRASGKR